MTAKLNATFKPLTDAQERITGFTKAAGFAQLGSALSGVASGVGGVVRAFEVGFLRVGAILGGVALTLGLIVGGTAHAGDEAIKASRRLGIRYMRATKSRFSRIDRSS